MDGTIHQPKKKKQRSGSNDGDPGGCSTRTEIDQQQQQQQQQQLEEARRKAERRRARNRASAAKSRQKTRDAIVHLETEADTAKVKYEAALLYILNLETSPGTAMTTGGAASSAHQPAISLCPPAVLCRDLAELRKTSPQLLIRGSGNNNRNAAAFSARSTVLPAKIASSSGGSNGNITSSSISGGGCYNAAAAPAAPARVISDVSTGGNSSVSSAIKEDESNNNHIESSLYPSSLLDPSPIVCNSGATMTAAATGGGKIQNCDPLPLSADFFRNHDHAMVDFWAKNAFAAAAGPSSNNAAMNNLNPNPLRCASAGPSYNNAAMNPNPNPLPCKSSSSSNSAVFAPVAPAALGTEFD